MLSATPGTAACVYAVILNLGTGAEPCEVSGAGKLPLLTISKSFFSTCIFKKKIHFKEKHATTKHHSNSKDWIFNHISVLQVSYYTEQHCHTK